MTPAAHRITDELLAAIAQEKALYEDGTVVPFARGRAREKIWKLADKLAEERARPMASVIKPWSRWTPTPGSRL